jgi:hypothetical protein
VLLCYAKACLTKLELRHTFLSMAMQTSRVRKAVMAERTYRGEAAARFLVGQLNKGLINSEPIRGIILALQEMSSGPTQRKQSSIEAANKILSAYQARPRLRPESKARDGFRLDWQRLEGDDLELRVVLRALELAQEGRIASLKECANPNCKQWLFARFKHHRFCSDVCKELFHRTDPQEKARRRDWAKDNYWKHQHKNIK